jgi:hypothetical protein
MYRCTTTLLAGLALAGAMAPAASTASPIAQIACMHATIGGQSKCIAKGQFCSRSLASQYRRYGLKCTRRDANGRYHLTS